MEPYLSRGNEKILVSEMEEKSYASWQLHFRCQECQKNIINERYDRYKRKIEERKFICGNCITKLRYKKKSYNKESINKKIPYLRKGNKYIPIEKLGEDTYKGWYLYYKCEECKNSIIDKTWQHFKEKIFKKQFICGICHRKKTNLKKYGGISPTHNEKIRKKIQKTSLERYGVSCSLQNEEVKEKIRQTSLDKYGTNTPSQNEEVKEKIRQTNLDKYGTNTPSQNEDVKEKTRQTNLER